MDTNTINDPLTHGAAPPARLFTIPEMFIAKGCGYETIVYTASWSQADVDFMIGQAADVLMQRGISVCKTKAEKDAAADAVEARLNGNPSQAGRTSNPAEQAARDAAMAWLRKNGHKADVPSKIRGWDWRAAIRAAEPAHGNMLIEKMEAHGAHVAKVMASGLDISIG